MNIATKLHTERLSVLLKVAQLVSGSTGIQTRYLALELNHNCAATVDPASIS